MEWSFQSTVWLRNNGKSPASRHFVTLPNDIADAIKAQRVSEPRLGFGSVKTQAMIGYITRETSIFPDKKSGSYLLCIKKNIREELRIVEGSQLYITLTLI